MKPPVTPPRSIDLPPLALRADVRPDTVNAEARTTDVVFSTGAPVPRYDWMSDTRYIETLSLKRPHVRLDRLNDGAPFLNTHSAYALSDVLGVVVSGSARIVDGQAVATIRFSKRDDVEPIFQDIRDGIIRNVSVGYRVHKYEQTEASEGKPALRHAVDWEPYEISAVPMPADNGAKVRADQPQVTNPCVVLTRAVKETTPMDEILCQRCQHTNPAEQKFCGACGGGLVVAADAPAAAEQPHVADPLDPGAPSVAAAVQERFDKAITDRQQGIEVERRRSQGIRRAVRNAGFEETMADALIADGTSLEQAMDKVLEALGTMERKIGGPGPNSGRDVIQLGSELATKHIRAGIENALLHRVAPDYFKLDDGGRAYAGSSLLDCARYTLNARNIRTTGMSKMEIAGLALGLNTRGPSGYHTTSDFANILADVANKTLRRAYEEAPQTFTVFSRRVELPDFKPTRRVQIGEAPALLEVKEHGEFTRGTIGDAKETFQLATYGRVFAITRQALVNDDTDAFSRLATMFGRAARNLESNLVWTQITTNPLMGDGFALFSTQHGNLAAAPAAIDITSLGIARAAMRIQKGLDGVEPLNVVPKFLVVPTTKETIADQQTAAITPAVGTNVNPFSGKLTVIAEPRLDANSTTAWYLFATTDQIDIVEYGFLAGEAGPVVESRVGFDIDGLEVKCRHDVAAKAIDWRGAFKNAGA